MTHVIKSLFAGAGSDSLTHFRFEFNAPAGLSVCILAILAAALGVSLYCWPRLSRLEPKARVILVLLRSAIVALALFMLLDPCLTADRIHPGERRILLLFDNSMSMKIAGANGRSRGNQMKEIYQRESETFEGKLAKNFNLTRYAFGEGIAPVKSAGDLDFSERESDLTGSIESARNEMEGLDIAAVVIFSDGIQQVQARGSEEPKDPLRSLPAATPVFCIGADAEAPWRDLELGALTVTRTHFDKSPVVVSAPVRALGLAGSEAIVEVLESGRVVKSQTFSIGQEDQEYEARMEFIPETKGWLDYSVSARLATPSGVPSPIPGPEGRAGEAESALDRIIENNEARFLIDNRDKTYRILYFAGRPSWENKFIRRALQDDEQLKLTSLIRISKGQTKFTFRGKESGSRNNPLFEGFASEGGDGPRYDESVFLRIGVQGSELDKGYPSLGDALYPFNLVIWGEIEHHFFSQQQMELTRDYVRKRGGALLFLGGPHSFTEGNYDATIMESMMPMLLASSSGEKAKGAPENMKAGFSVTPTVEGGLSGAWLLDPDPENNRHFWETMPELKGLNLFPMLRPGAVVMARAEGVPSKTDNSAAGVAIHGAPLFISQRYGEGRTAALATGSTWPWQLKLDLEDTRHERLWRQMIRSLVEKSPEPIEMRNKRENYVAGQETGFDFIVRDKLWDAKEGLRVNVKLTNPGGVESALPVEESIQEAGLYASSFTPEEPGVYKLSLEALTEKNEAVGQMTEAILVQPDQREFQKAQYDPSFLKRIAAQTKGSFFPISDLSSVADRISAVTASRKDVVRIHLWKFPGFFAAFAIMLPLEWYLRRKRGYA